MCMYTHMGPIVSNILLCSAGNVIPWAKVARSFSNRTDSSCRNRWRMLSSEEDKSEYYKTIKMKEKIKVSCSKSKNVLELTVNQYLCHRAVYARPLSH